MEIEQPNTLTNQMLETDDELMAHIMRLEKNPTEIRRLLTEFALVSGERGVAITGSVSGSIVITGDKNIIVADGGQLARWWEEVGPEPNALLPDYQSRVAAAYASLRFPLGSLPRPILLDEVFSELPIVKAPSDEALLQLQRPGQRVSGDLIPQPDELVRRLGRAALVGILGMGKTTTLRYLAWLYARRPEHRLYWSPRQMVPFYARLSDLADLWASAARTRPESFIDAMAAATARAMGGAFGARNLARLLQAVVDRGEALLLLDALDEFHATDQDRLAFVEALQTLWTSAPFVSNRLLLTSRPYRFLNLHGFQQYALQSSEQEVERLIYRLGRAFLQARREDISEEEKEAWLGQIMRAIDAPRLRELWTPFYVTLMVHLGTGTSSAVEGVELLGRVHGLADLYRYFLWKTLEWERTKGNEPGATDDVALLALGYLAYDCFVERSEGLEAEQLARSLSSTVAEANSLVQFWLGTGLLYRDEFRRRIGFNFAGFQAYGVALALADKAQHGQRNQVTELMMSHAWDVDWDLTRQLYAALA